MADRDRGRLLASCSTALACWNKEELANVQVTYDSPKCYLVRLRLPFSRPREGCVRDGLLAGLRPDSAFPSVR
jgi:hypothetical protein